ncbi:uncharacterized protein LOC106141340 isoform X2 [Amyelois transitella]|uniref:uncharacterized protein LOC106141340 isoform X2 n=1 Tax=Amyelois transitella TaxID=680683 RepID=UPI00298F56E3|nr:uncharacterized protein LOC106141340 isoform X2 [Amyelois transitella]
MDYYNGNSHGESSQMEHTPAYSLWNSSQYYNTNELSPRNFFTSKDDHIEPEASFAAEATPKREILRDMFNRRVITKASLLKEPEFFTEPEIKDPVQEETPTPAPIPELLEETSSEPISEPQPYVPGREEWTDQYWQRSGSTLKPKGTLPKAGKARRTKDTQFKDKTFKKNFIDALAQPLKSSKAESMMQKMGWQGGALGKGGHGIMEPIAPNIHYAQSTIGFGNHTETPEPQTPKKKLKKCTCKKQRTRVQIKRDFVTNTLLYILEFIRNDWETEIVFDPKFSSKERRMIHQCVNDLINECDDEIHGNRNMVKITSEVQEKILADIRQFNKYALYTESHGIGNKRHLCLYKDAPEHVYLVTPEDFKVVEQEQPVVEVMEDNPFLKSIKRNLDLDELTEPGAMGKLIKYFSEFVLEDSYTEFRFLGPFSEDESDCLNAFLNEVEAGIDNRGKLTRLFEDDKLSFELRENCNGGMA